MMSRSNLLGVKIGNDSIAQLLKKVRHFIDRPSSKVFHITNLNPDIFYIAYRDQRLRSIINNSSSILIDGIGVKIAARLYGVSSGERMTGTDFMKKLIELAVRKNKKVMFLGGKNNTALLTANYFIKRFPQLNLESDPGAKNIESETNIERNRVLRKIIKFKPDFLFVAYGPPFQEFWIEKNKKILKGIVCLGVGGSFNFFANKAMRAPLQIRKLGFEWLWRFIIEPKRTPAKLGNYWNFSKLILSNLLSNKNLFNLNK